MSLSRACAGLALAALLGAAGAQDLGAYQRLAGSLERAAQVRPASAQAALENLDAAQTALTELLPTLRNRQISAGLNETMRASRAALSRTPAELEAQVLLARGLMRKALYDQTMTQLGSGQDGGAANGAAQLRLLAREFGLSGAGSQALEADAGAGRLTRVAWRLQREAADRTLAALNAARAQQTTASYVALARAAGWFTVVQDANGVGELTLAQFGGALRQLTAGDLPGLAQSLATLRAGMNTFTQVLAAPPGTGAPLAPPAPAPEPDEEDPAAEPPAGVQAAPGTAEVYAALGRALSAAGHGDGPGARAQLRRAGAALAAGPAALRGAGRYPGLRAALAAAAERPAPRPAEVQALIAGLGGLEAELAGKPLSTLDRVSGAVAGGLSGWWRAGLFALLAALALVPLYLLNLAFGGRNAYWRAILGGLVVLLLPLFLEGLFGLLGTLGDALDAPALRLLSSWTPAQGAYLLPLWALGAALAVGLLTYGFRGLCEQFGLLGRAPAVTSTQHSLEWDEES